MPKAAFEDEMFVISYQVLLTKGIQEGAYKVAKAAVAQATLSLPWRQRLAQISEWTQRPEEALVQWLYLAEHPPPPSAKAKAQGQLEAPLIDSTLVWANVKRLSKALGQILIQIQVLEFEQSLAYSDTKTDLEILALEEVLGETDRAIVRLKKRIAQLGAPNNAPLVEAFFELSISIQTPKLIIEAALLANKLYGTDLRRSSILANVWSENGDVEGAFHLLYDLVGLAKDSSSLSVDLDRKIHFRSQLGLH